MGVLIGLDKCKSLQCLAIALDAFCKHRRRSYPDAMIAIERSIYYVIFSRFAVPGKLYDLVAIAFEVLVDTLADSHACTFCVGC